MEDKSIYYLVMTYESYDGNNYFRQYMTEKSE